MKANEIEVGKYYYVSYGSYAHIIKVLGVGDKEVVGRCYTEPFYNLNLSYDISNIISIYNFDIPKKKPWWRFW